MKRKARRKLILKWAIISAVLLVGLVYQGAATTLKQVGPDFPGVSAFLLGVPGVPTLAAIQPGTTIPGTSWNWGLGIVFLIAFLCGFAFLRLIHHIRKLQDEH